MKYLMLLQETQVLLLEADLTALSINQVPALVIHQIPVFIDIIMT